MFRRVVGLGVGRATNESELESVLTYMNGLGSRYAIPVAPQSQPSTLSSWLEKRGFTPGYAWMKFCRPCEGAPQILLPIWRFALSAASKRRVRASSGRGVRAVDSGRAMGRCAGRKGELGLRDGVRRCRPVAAGAVYVAGSMRGSGSARPWRRIAVTAHKVD